MTKKILNPNNKKFWKLRITLVFFFFLSFGAIPANAKMEGLSWQIVRIIDAGTFEVIIPDWPVNTNHAAVHLIIENKYKLPRLLKNASGSCGREYDAAVKALQYVQDVISKSKEVSFANPEGLDELMQGKTREINADVIIDGQSLKDLLQSKDLIRYYWCI